MAFLAASMNGNLLGIKPKGGEISSSRGSPSRVRLGGPNNNSKAGKGSPARSKPTGVTGQAPSAINTSSLIGQAASVASTPSPYKKTKKTKQPGC